MPTAKGAKKGKSKTSQPMSRLRGASASEVIAVFCSDLHFSDTAPIARSTEPDWFVAMRRSFRQVINLANSHNVPVVIAGDIFHKWNPSPRLINFVIGMFSKLNKEPIAIPGNHDLRYHNLEDIEHTGYWTLVQADILTHLDPDGTECILNTRHGGITLHPFPCGREITPLEEKITSYNIAIVHDYVWRDERTKHAKAPDEASVGAFARKCIGYDAVVIGDNHKGWKQGNFFNCGTLIRRNIDEISYRPQVGILFNYRGKLLIEPHYLGLEGEHEFFSGGSITQEETHDKRIEEALVALGRLGKQVVDFSEDLKHAMREGQVSDEVREIILKCQEKGLK